MRVLVTKMTDPGSMPAGDEKRTGAVQAGLLLAASRRVDWRFLLPDPDLGDVICVGPVTETLADALQIFSASLVNWNPDDDGDKYGGVSPHDVAVACDPSRLSLGDMASLLKPGGHVYLEAHGPASLFRLSQLPARWAVLRQRDLWRPKAYERVLQALGFTRIQTHWHWPDFEHCKMIVPLTPLDRPAAARYALTRSGRGMTARLGAELGRFLVWSGLLPGTVPCFSVLAQWSVS